MDTAEQAPQKKRTCRNRTLVRSLWAVIVLLLVAVGVLGYLLVEANDNARVSENKLGASQRQVTDLERRVADVSKEKSNESTVVTNTSSTDSEEIIKTTLAQARANIGSESTEFKVSIEKLELPFARASIGGGNGAAGGAVCILKKVDDQWVQLYCAQNEMPELEQQYGVPRSVIDS